MHGWTVLGRRKLRTSGGTRLCQCRQSCSHRRACRLQWQCRSSDTTYQYQRHGIALLLQGRLTRRVASALCAELLRSVSQSVPLSAATAGTTPTRSWETRRAADRPRRAIYALVHALSSPDPTLCPPLLSSIEPSLCSRSSSTSPAAASVNQSPLSLLTALFARHVCRL